MNEVIAVPIELFRHATKKTLGLRRQPGEEAEKAMGRQCKLVHVVTTPDNVELNVVVRDGELFILVAADADVMTEMRLNEPNGLENKFGKESADDAKRIFTFLTFLLDSPDALAYVASLHKTSGELLEALKKRNKTDRNVLAGILHNAWNMNDLIRSDIWPPLASENKWKDE